MPRTINPSLRRTDMAPNSPMFDTWLQSSLQRRYDETLSEPLPPELLRLILDPADGARS